jgi:ketosteroid isomerase-like protein
MWDPERAVLEANLAFYEAFAAQSFEAMARAWATEQPVVCIHPGWQPLYGREEVMASWRAILSGEPTEIRCESPRVLVHDEVGLVTCLERIGGAPARSGSEITHLAATNVFVLEEGVWRMIHHQAGPFADRTVGGEMAPPPESLN